MEYTVSITIDAPAARVWSILSDVERWPEWTASITSVQRLGSGTFALGSRARVAQPKLSPMVWTVTSMQVNRSFEWTATMPGVTSVGGHRIADGPGDGVTVTLSIRQTGLLAPIIGLFAGGLTRRYIEMEAEGLKRRAESATPAMSTARSAV